MGRGNKFPLDEDYLVNLYTGGMRKSEIAKLFGCTDKVILERLDKLGYPPKAPGIEHKFRLDEVELVGLYESGITKSALAVHFGCAESAIGKRLAKLGYPIAVNRSEAMRIRLQRAGPDARQILSSRAHDAVRGMVRTEENLIRGALGREIVGRLGSSQEKIFYNILKERGIDTICQKALWKYSIDFVIGNVAVEICGRRRKPEQVSDFEKRHKYILNAGFVLVYICTSIRFPITWLAAEYVITLIERSSFDPSVIGKYWVINGHGKSLTAGGIDDNNFTGILTPKSSAQ